MDHHCYFIGNCIGYANYKNFFLTLFFGVLYLAFIILHFSYLILYHFAIETILSKYYQFFVFTSLIISLIIFGFLSPLML